MTTIIVEKKYEDAFHSVCELLKDGFLADRRDGNDFVSARYDGATQSIIDGDFRYVLGTGREAAFDPAAEKSGKSGFGWFAGVRDYKKVSEKSRWESLMESVSRTYHKLYSLVEYKEKTSEASEERALADCRAVVERLFATFLPSRNAVLDVRPASEDVCDDYYGVTLRTDISGSTGASVPVLCKVYFKRSKGKPEPIDRRDAEEIEAYFEECFNDASITRNDEIRTDPIAERDDVIPVTIDAVDRLLKATGAHGEVTFQDAMFFAGREDEELVAGLVSQTAHDGAQLKVVGAKMLGVSHVRWRAHAYDIYESGERTYRIMLGLNDLITLTCTGCGETVIDRNTIKLPRGESEEIIPIRPSTKNFGLTSRELDEIRALRLLEKHNYTLSCPENFRNKRCSRLVCLSDDRVFDYEKPNGDIVYHCKDCPYTEIAYTDASGRKRYTPTLSYASDVRDMVDSSTVHKCSVCGRNISSDDSRCPLCKSIGIAAGVPGARKLYGRYSSMLPISERMFVPSAQKRAYEDSEIILFCIGKKKFIVYKAQLKETGLNPRPKRLG